MCVCLTSLCVCVCVIHLQATVGITLLLTSNVGDLLSCHFRRSIDIDSNDKIYNLDQAYYLMLGVGPVDSAGKHNA